MYRRSLRGIAIGIVLAAFVSTIASPALAEPASGDNPDNPVHQYNATLATTLFRSVFNGGDVDATEALVSPNAVIHTPYGEFTGPEGLQDYLDIVRREYPDAWFDISSVDVVGDTVVVHWTMTASRFLTGPASTPLNVRVSDLGETRITVVDGAVAEMNHGSQEAAVADATEVSTTHRPTE